MLNQFPELVQSVADISHLLELICFLNDKRVESAHKWKLNSPERFEIRSHIFADFVQS